MAVDYDCTDLALELAPARRDGVWDYGPLLPLATGVTAGEGGTPLVEVELDGMRGYVKNEGVNPTGSFKDRFNAVNTTVALALGYETIVSTTTGNAGLSAALYAALAGLKARVFVAEEAPTIIGDAIRWCGAEVAVAARERHDGLLRAAVQDGAFPATTALSSAGATPFGLEGYKTIAFELVAALGRAPDRIFVPVGGGDGLYGVAKGFRELRQLGLVDALPRMYGVQSTSTDPLVRAFRDASNDVAAVERGETIAHSINDGTAGTHALDAIRESRGGAIAVTDEEILAAMHDLARLGVLAEPASAASVAGWRRCRSHAGAGEVDVCIVTSSFLKWLPAIPRGG